eukprot:scaffold154080_cov14-Prasinocladus_malaysianus.AAC.1
MAISPDMQGHHRATLYYAADFMCKSVTLAEVEGTADSTKLQHKQSVPPKSVLKKITLHMCASINLAFMLSQWQWVEAATNSSAN